MIRVRPAQQNDLPSLMKLVAKAGLGMTTMPQSDQSMLKRIYLSQESFARAEAPEQAETFFLVLEDEDGVIGTASIFTKLGYDRPFYSYRMSHMVNQSPDIDVRAETDVLYLVNDYHGYTEIGTLFIDPGHRGGGIGRFLSFSRFMLLAANPGRFGDRIMAEIRGWSNDEQSFPFWEHVASKFFHMSFVEADKRSASDFRFIADLMPKYPIYAELLPQEARDILGKPHRNSLAAMQLLQSQGFRHNKLIDIFDGGPSIDAYLDQIVTVSEAHKRKVKVGDAPKEGQKVLVSSIGLGDFVCIQTESDSDFGDEIILTETMIQELGLLETEEVLVAPLRGRKK